MSKEQLPDDTKRCGNCRKVLHVDCFSVARTRADGLQCWCDQCHHDYYKAHSERINAYTRARRAVDPEAMSARERNWKRLRKAQDALAKAGATP